MPRSLVLPAVLCLFLGAAHAGDLDPPPGPVAPTMRPLDVVEPRTPIGPDTTPGDALAEFVITQSGSYYLADNLYSLGGKDAIRVDAPFATIDLNGFFITGGGGSPNGIVSDYPHTTVRNGTIYAMTEFAIDLDDHALVENVAMSSVQHGVFAEDYAVVRNVRITGGVTPGMGVAVTGRAGLVEDCIVARCLSGIAAPNACIVRNCVVDQCEEQGIIAGQGSVVTGCTVSEIGEHGIITSGAAQIRDNMCVDCGETVATGAGIYAYGSGSRIEGNTVWLSRKGVWDNGSMNLVVRNFCSLNNTNFDLSTQTNAAERLVDPGSAFKTENGWANIEDTGP